MPVWAAWVLPWHLTWMSNQNLLRDDGLAGPSVAMVSLPKRHLGSTSCPSPGNEFHSPDFRRFQGSGESNKPGPGVGITAGSTLWPPELRTASPGPAEAGKGAPYLKVLLHRDANVALARDDEGIRL